MERDVLVEVARTALRTKVHQKLADHLAESVVDAVLSIRKDDDDVEPDLHMVEIMVINILNS